MISAEGELFLEMVGGVALKFYPGLFIYVFIYS